MEQDVVQGRCAVVLQGIGDLVQRQPGDVDRQRLVEPEGRPGPEAEDQAGATTSTTPAPATTRSTAAESGNLLWHGPHGRTQAFGSRIMRRQAGGPRNGRSQADRKGEETHVGRYIVKRVVLLFIIILFVSVVSFFLVHLLPGNPATTILGPNATPQNVATLNHQLGLDKPLWQQYFIWIGHVFQGNLGQSYTTHQTTTSIISAVVPHRPRADHLLPDHRLRHRLPDGDALGTRSRTGCSTRPPTARPSPCWRYPRS